MRHLQMMHEDVVVLLAWFWGGMALVGVMALGVGLLSALSPRQSIRLYQWIMARFNWRVSPIDETREIRNTRLLGLLLIGLAVVALWLSVAQWR